MNPLRAPDFAGRSLLNLVAELELRLTGHARASGLAPELSNLIPSGRTYVFCLFDGLGDSMLPHRAASPLAESRVGVLDAMFPTQTTVNMATIATGLPPSQHGLIAYQLYLPELDQVVNTLKWTTLWGERVDIDTSGFLPAPNLWERLQAAGIEPITVQPGGFADSPLTGALYRGCRFEPAWTVDEISEATIQLAGEPGRLIFTYFPSVDVAAHMHGQQSLVFTEVVEAAAAIWQRIRARLPAHAVAVASADHGHIDYPTEDKHLIRDRIDGLTFYGNPRTSFIRGSAEAIAGLTRRHPGTWVPWEEVLPLLGPGPVHEAVQARAPAGLLVADPGMVLLPPNADKRMIGYHGGTLDEEMKVPLLVGTVS